MKPDIFELSAPAMIGILVAFFAIMMTLSTLIARRSERADDWVVSNRHVGFGLSAATVMATAIWAPSFYGAAISGYQYGLSGPIHYGIWGALIFIILAPYGKRIRELSPRGHTLAELMYARHGPTAHASMGVTAVLHSGISLMLNLTAAGALISVLSPLSFNVGVLATAGIILLYTFWSGFRASVITDFVQVSAVGLITIVVIPVILFNLGGPSALAAGVDDLGPELGSFLSREAVLKQGAPMFVAILSWAFANQPMMQRIYAVRPDKVRSALVVGGIGYGSIVTGLGMLGLMAVIIGVEPVGGNVNNIVPQMATTFLPVALIILFAFLVLCALASTCDSDLSSLAALMMTDVYRRYMARGQIANRTMLRIGRATMITMSAIAVILATLRVSILVGLLIGASLYGAIVFPTVASMYWRRVTNAAFTCAVVAGLVLSATINFELLALPEGTLHRYVIEAVAIVGGSVVIGLLLFPFLGRIVAFVAGGLTFIAMLPLFGFLGDYTLLTAALVTYGASAIVCTGMSLLAKSEFDFEKIPYRVPELFSEDSTLLQPHKERVS